jgi:hypothetical protein
MYYEAASSVKKADYKILLFHEEGDKYGNEISERVLNLN